METSLHSDFAKVERATSPSPIEHLSWPKLHSLAHFDFVGKLEIVAIERNFGFGSFGIGAIVGVRLA